MCSPRHVPAIILPIDDIPYTINGKKVEIAVKKILKGEDVLNRDALANPESLDLYKNIPALKPWSIISTKNNPNNILIKVFIGN